MGCSSHQAMGYVDNHPSAFLLSLLPLGGEAGQAWAHAAWMRQMPALSLWEYQPAPGNLLYTIPVAAEVVGEIGLDPSAGKH